MKLVPELRAETRGAVSPVSIAVLQVTESAVPRLSSGSIWITLLAVTAEVSTTQVPVEAFVAQENSPAAAALHDATDGLAADPAAAQCVVVLIVVPVSVVKEPADAVVPPIAPGDGKEDVDPPRLTEVPAIVMAELARSALGIEL